MSAVRTRRRERPNRLPSLTSATSPLGLESEARAAAIADNHRLQVVYLPIEDVKEPNRKLRRYSKRQLVALKASVTEYGMNRPIMIDGDGTIIAGVALWLTAKALGHKTIPVIRIEHLSPEQVRLYRLADNKLQMGEWDEAELRLEFLELGELSLECNLDLDLEMSGFTSKEIDDRTLPRPTKDGDGDGDGGLDDGDEDDDTEPPAGPWVTRFGDVWIIGRDHKIICGNSLEEETYTALMGDERAQMVISDGPYGVRIRGNVSSRKDAQEFQYASGGQSFEEFIAFERPVMRNLCSYSVDGSIHYHFISWHFLCELLQAVRAEYTELKNVLVWSKSHGSRGFYRSQHELVAVAKHGTAPHICTFGIEKGARVRTNVINYPGCNSFGPTRDEDLADHVTCKPVGLLSDLMRDCSRRGGLILDPFGGSGATLLAAHWTGRRARLIELEPRYVDVTIRRAARRFGLDAVLAATGQTFAEVAAERLGEEYCGEDGPAQDEEIEDDLVELEDPDDDEPGDDDPEDPGDDDFGKWTFDTCDEDGSDD